MEADDQVNNNLEEVETVGFNVVVEVGEGSKAVITVVVDEVAETYQILHHKTGPLCHTKNSKVYWMHEGPGAKLALSRGIQLTFNPQFLILLTLIFQLP